MNQQTSQYEPLLNGQLAGLLVEEGLDAEAEVPVPGGRLDIKVKFTTHIVAIECENFGIGKKTEATSDAMKRIVAADEYGQWVADIAVALVYPSNCSESDLSITEELEYSIVHPADAAQKKPHEVAAIANWSLGSVKNLAAAIRRLKDDVGDPDVSAQKLDSALKDAVDRLSHNQRKLAVNALNLPDDEKDTDLYAATKRAMLVVASASMFHARLNDSLNDMKPEMDARTGRQFSDHWPPKTLQECLQSEDLIGELRETWHLILSVDYRPIFETGIAVLDNVIHNPNFSAAVRRVVAASLAIVRVVEGLRHDLLGRIFHAVLDNARYDGSFYTTTSAATLLTGLALRNSDDLPVNLADLRVIDPSCGTGTLLMAVAERIRDISESSNDAVLIENVLSGYDINLTATHLAATTLGLLSPTTKFQKMNIFIAAFGATENHIHEVKTGSLEIYDERDRLPVFEWPGSMAQFETGVSRKGVDKADLVIMNPPFTRNSLRHDQLGVQIKKAVKKREQEIFANAPVDVSFTSSGPAFLVLAEYLAKSDSSTVALILPLVASMNPSTHGVRQFLASKFHIETVVVPHDPKRFWFSENTSIAEMLVVMRRTGNDKPTRFINLARNPGTVHEALDLAEDIRLDRLENIDGLIQSWPREKINNGDWGAVQFFSPFLTSAFCQICSGELFKITRLGVVANVESTYRTARSTMKPVSNPDRHGRRGLWHFKTDVTKSMRATTDTALVAKDNQESADRVWERRSKFLLPVKVQTNLARVIAVRLDTPTLGSYWVTINFRKQSELYEKAMCVWLNSTLGVVSMLGIRTPKKPCYPDFSVKEQNNIPLPDLKYGQLKVLSDAFDKLADMVLGRWSDANDSGRTRLDEVIIDVLNLDSEFVTQVREEPAREPMCTNRRYAE